MVDGNLLALSLLIVEDDEIALQNLKVALSTKIATIYCVQDGLSAYDMFIKKRPDVVLTDVKLPNMDGIELTGYIKELSEETQVIVMSGYSEQEIMRRALDAGVSIYIKKPLDMDELLFVLKAAAFKKSIQSIQQASGYTLRNSSLQNGDEAIQLSSKEYAIVQILFKNAGKAVTHEALENLTSMSRGAIRNHISNVNKKAMNLIQNSSGVGYFVSK